MVGVMQSFAGAEANPCIYVAQPFAAVIYISNDSIYFPEAKKVVEADLQEGDHVIVDGEGGQDHLNDIICGFAIVSEA